MKPKQKITQRWLRSIGFEFEAGPMPRLVKRSPDDALRSLAVRVAFGLDDWRIRDRQAIVAVPGIKTRDDVAAVLKLFCLD